jgi:peptidyl-prolyl cis-trans isomerase A (cyclophilin A)
MKTFARVACLLLVVLAVSVPAAARAEEKQKQSPDSFKVKFETSKGVFVIEVNRNSAPIGADRFHQAVTDGFYDGCRFFRVLDGFMAQFGINGDPKVQKKWKQATIKDDPVTLSNKRGTISFATSGKNSRTTQLFINFGDNSRLDEYGFAPFGKVVDGMKVVDSLYNGYGEAAPEGNGPSQSKVQAEGNVYLIKEFPKLDFIKTARVVKPGKPKK